MRIRSLRSPQRRRRLWRFCRSSGISLLAALLVPALCSAQQAGPGVLPGYRSPASGGTVTSPILFPDGSASAPSITFASATGFGLFTKSSGVQVAAGSSSGAVASFYGSDLRLTQSMGLGWSNGFSDATSADLSLFREAAGTLAQRNGTNAQTSNLYNTTDGTNKEYLSSSWASNVATISTTKTGTGTLRALVIGNVTTVAGLPTCGATSKAARAFVTDANATTFLSTVAGGGANNVPVVCNGTNWVIGG